MSRYTAKQDKMYLQYKTDLLRKRVQVEAAGGELAQPRPLSKRDFLDTYQSIYTSRKNDVRIGERKAIGNIRRDMINRQTYVYTQGQARAIRNAYLRTLDKDSKGRPIYELDDEGKAIKPRISDIRINANYINDTIIDIDGLYELSSKTYYAYLNAGKTSAEAKLLVSQEIWGSP